MQTYDMNPQRLGRFKGEILKHAEPMEMLCKMGRAVKYPRNNSDTYTARRYLPYGATSASATSQNTFFQNGTGDRGNAIVQAHQTQEGVTPLPDSISSVDVTVVIQEYAFLYGFTNKTFDFYEDDIPKEINKQIGERVTFVSEMIAYGVLRSCTNVYYGGAGTTIATVNGPVSLGQLQRIVENLRDNHAKMVTSQVSASALFGTEPIAAGYLVYCSTRLAADIRKMAGYTPIEKYASVKPMPGELGKVEEFRFIGHPDLPGLQDAGAAVGATDCRSTTGVNLDVYPMIVVGEDAWSRVSVRGKDALKPTYLPPGVASKSDQFGQRGYAGTLWYSGMMIENHGWMALLYVAVKNHVL